MIKKLIKHYKSVLKLNQSSLLHYGGHFLPLWYEKHRFFVQKTAVSGQIKYLCQILKCAFKLKKFERKLSKILKKKDGKENDTQKLGGGIF